MPRIKGAKNKPKSDSELIEALKNRGYNVSKFAEKQPENTTAKVTVKRSKLIIEKPVKIAAKQSEVLSDKDTVCRCGNPACGKVLTGEISPCPYCGANLKW